MDECEAELLRLLYTRVGMIMEDASVLAINLCAPSSAFDAEQVAKLQQAPDAIASLARQLKPSGNDRNAPQSKT